MVERIDVAVVARNEAALIGRTLQSIHGQQLDDRYHFQVTVWANACTDNTAEVARQTIEQLTKTKSRLGLSYKVIERSQPGQVVTINAALYDSKTELFVCTDGDVTFSPNCFTAVIDKLHESGIILSGPVHHAIIADSTDPLVVKLYDIRKLLRRVTEAEGVYTPAPVGGMLAFNRKLLNEIPVNAYASDTYVLLLAMTKYGAQAFQTVANATVYTVATKTYEDFMASEKRVDVANRKILADFAELRAAYDEFYRNYPESPAAIDRLLKPHLESAQLSLDDMKLWHRAWKEIAQAKNMNEFLRPDGTWVPIESTKRLG